MSQLYHDIDRFCHKIPHALSRIENIHDFIIANFGSLPQSGMLGFQEILMIALLIIAGVVVVLGLWAIAAFNGLVSLREQVRSGWAQIDVVLKRRHDLIPNLVETVKGYAAHEKETLTNVIAARNQAAAAATPQQSAAAEGALSGALRQLFAVAEAYPDLKANQNFMQLQSELEATENQISGFRQSYNDLVRRYNTAIMSFPNNLMAGPFGFVPQPFFEIQDAAQREVPVVKF
jgi:LemA protein